MPLPCSLSTRLHKPADIDTLTEHTTSCSIATGQISRHSHFLGIQLHMCSYLRETPGLNFSCSTSHSSLRTKRMPWYPGPPVNTSDQKLQDLQNTNEQSHDEQRMDWSHVSALPVVLVWRSSQNPSSWHSATSSYWVTMQRKNR